MFEFQFDVSLLSNKDILRVLSWTSSIVSFFNRQKGQWKSPEDTVKKEIKWCQKIWYVFLNVAERFGYKAGSAGHDL